MTPRTVCLLGGTGFVGRSLTLQLLRAGYRLRIPTRYPHRHKDLLVLPGALLMSGSVHDPAFLNRLLAGADAAINLVGVLNDGRGPDSFAAAHVTLPQSLVTACHAQGVRRLLHISALNAEPLARSRYLRTKAAGEEVVRVADLDTTVFRPSVIFGRRDGLLNRFARVLAWSPGVLPLACPTARFQPAYVEDVAQAFVRALAEHRHHGQTYALCGPRIYTLRQIVDYVAQLQRRRCKILGLNDRLSRWQAAVAEFLPGKPFSRDNYYSLQVDSVCEGENALTETFGIQPTPLEQIAPSYISPR